MGLEGPRRLHTACFGLGHDFFKFGSVDRGAVRGSLLCFARARLDHDRREACLTAGPPRPSYAVAPSVSSEATTAREEQLQEGSML